MEITKDLMDCSELVEENIGEWLEENDYTGEYELVSEEDAQKRVVEIIGEPEAIEYLAGVSMRDNNTQTPYQIATGDATSGQWSNVITTTSGGSIGGYSPYATTTSGTGAGLTLGHGHTSTGNILVSGNNIRITDDELSYGGISLSSDKEVFFFIAENHKTTIVGKGILTTKVFFEDFKLKLRAATDFELMAEENLKPIEILSKKNS